MRRTLITAAALYLLYERQKAMEMRLRALEQEWRASELAAAAAADQIEAWAESLTREEGAR